MPIPSGVDQKKSKVYVQKSGGEYIQILPESFCESEILEGSMWPVSSHALKQYSNSIEERIAPFAGATANKVGKIGTVPEAKSSERTYFLRGDGKWVQIVLTDEKVKAIKDATKRFYLTGTDINDTNVSVSYFDSGVYVSANAGELCATKFKGNLEGNVKGNLEGTASKAIADANGNNIANTYATKALVSNSYAPLSHTHPSTDINALNGYSKGNSTAAIAATDTLNQALGKLEKRADTAASLESPAFTGTPTVPNLSSNSTDRQIANKKYVDDKISGVIGGASSSFDTLKELANAIGNDASFATTVNNKLATKLDKNSSGYIKTLSISDNTAGSGQILKVQRGDDTNFTLTIKDTTYTPAAAAPLAPASTAKVGTSVKYAREDHVHPLQTTVSGKASSADSADKLTTARQLRANLAATAAATFDGTANQLNIPVTGILPVANGGTGASNLNGLVQTGNVNQTIAGTKTFSNTIAGSINGNAATATTATKVQATPAGTSWVAGVQTGKALVNATTTGYGALLNASTKNYKVGLSTYPSNSDLVYLYSVTNANAASSTNTVAKSLTWNADTGELTANSFKGNLIGTATACSGNATSATKATQDGDGKVISDTYLKNTGGTITGTLNLTRTTDAQGTGTNAPALRIGELSGAHLEFDGNEIMAKASGNTVGTLSLNADGGLVSIGSGGLTVGGTITGNLKGNVTGNVSGSSGSCTGNAATATKLGTARNLYVADNSGTNTGPAASFDGTANATIKLPATIKANITGNVSGSSGSCTGNAATATTATKLGTATVGSASKPIYLNAGVPTALTANVGNSYTPVYLNAGTVTACTSISATKDGAGNQIDTTYLKNTGGTVTGTLNLTKTTDAQGTGTAEPALRIGALTGAHLEFDGNEIMAKATSNTVGPLYLNADGGLVSIGSGGLTVSGTITGNLKGNVTGNVSGSSGSCTGNAASATKLATARNFYVADNSATNTGPAASFNGTANATIKLPATIKANITGNVSGSSGICTGNAASATKLATARSLWGNNFDGTAAVSGSITIAAAAGKVITRNSNVTRNTAPSANQWNQGLCFQDKNNVALGGVEHGYLTDKTNRLNLIVYKGTTTDTSANAQISVGYDKDGNWFTYAPTPATADSSTKIATTAFVKAQGYVTGSGSISGNAATATKLKTARTINGVAFDGSANITVADSTKVAKAGDTMTGNLTISKSTPYLCLKSTNITKNTAPSSNFTSVVVENLDNASKRLWGIYYNYNTDKTSYVRLIVNKGTTTDNTWTGLGVGYDKDGNWFTYAPTPATADNSTKIATTAFVKAQGYVTGSGSISGNAASSTKLQTARNFYVADNSSTNIGPATSFNGTANATIKLPATIKANITGNCSGSSGSCTGLAAKATGDADGNAIKTTYLKLSGGTMTGNIVFTDKTILFDNSTLAYNGTPSSNVTHGALYWRDKSDNYVSRMMYYKNTDNSMGMTFGMCKHGTNNSSGYTTLLGLKLESNGTGYATCPTPPAGDKSTKIATTAWVQNASNLSTLLSTINAVPSQNVIWKENNTQYTADTNGYVIYQSWNNGHCGRNYLDVNGMTFEVRDSNYGSGECGHNIYMTCPVRKGWWYKSRPSWGGCNLWWMPC